MSFSTCFGIISKSPNTSPRMLKAAQRVPVPSRKGGAKWQQHEGLSPVPWQPAAPGCRCGTAEPALLSRVRARAGEARRSKAEGQIDKHI